jgi:hypothetical protein
MISVIIPVANRDVDVLREVCSLLLVAGADEVIIGNIGKYRTTLATDRVREVHVPLPFWSGCISRNTAAQVAVGGVLVFTLADCLLATPERFQAFCQVPDGVLRTAAHCAYLNEHESRRALDGYRGFPDAHWRHDGYWIGALMAVNRKDFFDRIRGWDPEILHWGYEDRDLIARAKVMGMKHELFDITMLHIDHPKIDRSHHESNKQISDKKIAMDWWRYKQLSGGG